MKIIAHRGVGTNKFNADGPFENSIDSFSQAFELKKVFAVETDLRLTKDEIIVCHHDPSADNFRINYISYGELISFRSFVPKFEDVLTAFPNRKFIFELKPDEDNEKIINKIFSDYIGKLIKSENLMFISFDPNVLLKVKSINKDIYCSWIVTNINTDTNRKYHIFITKKDIEFCVENHIDEISGDYRVILDSTIKYAHSKGIKVGVGMINDIKTLNKIRKKEVDAIYTDRPQLICESC